MPKYRVTRRYAAILEGVCEVDAASEDEAIEKALVSTEWSDFEDTGDTVDEPDAGLNEIEAELVINDNN